MNYKSTLKIVTTPTTTGEINITLSAREAFVIARILGNSKYDETLKLVNDNELPLRLPQSLNDTPFTRAEVIDTTSGFYRAACDIFDDLSY